MDEFLNQLLERASQFLGARPGLLPLAGLSLILLNLALQIVPGAGSWIVDSNLFLHIGLVVVVLGLLLIKPLG